MIVINNPNNPTGSTTPQPVLEAIVAFAKERDIILFSDEVYSPLYHSLPPGQDPPPSVLALGYSKTIATGSMSKAFALAGIRTGWIASRDRALIGAIEQARDYTTISVSQLDDQVASYALSEPVQGPLLRRNTQLAQVNLGMLSAFIERHSDVWYVGLSLFFSPYLGRGYFESYWEPVCARTATETAQMGIQ